MKRCLTSKRLRAALWLHAKGKCQLCGVELGKIWHADHIVPWSVSKRTNVHEMQALCPACNLKKGDRMLDRSHQEQATKIAADIALGKSNKKNTIADVTPGGGKSRLATNFAKRLMQDHVVKHAIWGCPRAALVDQAIDSWKNAGLDPCRLTAIWYGNMAQQKQRLTDRCKHEPTLFIADELQFLADFEENKNGTWDSNAQAILELCEKYLGISGTLFSSKGLNLLGVNYLPAEQIKIKNPSMSDLYRHGRLYPDADIRYDLRRALEDEAVCPYKIVMSSVEFKPRDSDETFRLDDPESEEYKSLLREILLRESVWKPTVDQMIEEWKSYRKHYYQSGSIIVAASQDHVRDICDYLRRHNVQALPAISNDSERSRENIDIFKGKKFDATPRVLVTVAMAAVGLDVPHATHMAYLNNYRFWGFMLQAWARVSRICYDCGISSSSQMAYVYTTDDVRMAAFVDWIKKQQPIGYTSRDREPGHGPGPICDKQLESCGIVGRSYETSDDSPGYFGDQANAISSVTNLIPELANVPASIALAVAPFVDSSVATAKKTESSALLNNAGISPQLKRRAYKRGLHAIANKISKATEEEVSFVRMRLQNRNKIDFIEKDLSYMLRVFKNACAEAVNTIRADTIFLYWSAGATESQSNNKRENMKVSADECTRVCVEASIPLRFVVKERVK